MRSLRAIAFLTAATILAAVSCNKHTPDSPQPEPGPERDPIINLENPVVQSYLDMLELFPYRDGDYSYSRIDEYYQIPTSYRKDRPTPVTVTWTWDRDAVSQRVYISEKEDFSESLSWLVSARAESYDIYNLVPGKNYHWKTTITLSDGSTRELNSGSFSTEGRTRFIKIDNICNVRDLGGIPLADGVRRLKYGLLFRGGEMNGYHQDYDERFCRISSTGKKEMRQIGILADLDMRTATEAVNIKESPLGEDVDYIRFETANQYYYDKFWNTDDYIRAVKWTIDELRKGKPVFFHCIFGADRTGTLAFIMEAALGVGENELSIDYELTSFSYGLSTPPRRRGPKNELSVYRYRQMVETLLTPAFPGVTLQEKIRGFLVRGGISEADLDWFTDYMTEQIPS